MVCMRMTKILLVSFCCVAFFVSCTLDPICGGTIETTNSIAGVLYYSDGSPAENIPIYICHSDSLPDTTSQNTVLTDSVLAVTNESGRFFIKSLDSYTSTSKYWF